MEDLEETMMGSDGMVEVSTELNSAWFLYQ